MKSKIFTLFVAMMLLLGANVMAQSETLKEDVNGDGVVNVDDINAVISKMQELEAEEGVTYYWYANNDPEILFGDVMGCEIDWSKAQPVSSFNMLGFSTLGTTVTFKNSGINEVFILCPKSWSNKFRFNTAENLGLGLINISEYITNIVKDGVEYDLWSGDGLIGQKFNFQVTQ